MMLVDQYHSKNTKNSNTAGIVGCVLMLLAMYTLLLGPTNTVFSVYSLCEKTEQLCLNEQSLIFFLLPIYLAVMIFGGAALGWLAGKKAYHFLIRH